jgi:hypothetical protein
MPALPSYDRADMSHKVCASSYVGKPPDGGVNPLLEAEFELRDGVGIEGATATATAEPAGFRRYHRDEKGKLSEKPEREDRRVRRLPLRYMGWCVGGGLQVWAWEHAGI